MVVVVCVCVFASSTECSQCRWNVARSGVSMTRRYSEVISGFFVCVVWPHTRRNRRRNRIRHIRFDHQVEKNFIDKFEMNVECWWNMRKNVLEKCDRYNYNAICVWQSNYPKRESFRSLSMRKCHGSMMETESHRRNTQVELNRCMTMTAWLFSINRFVELCTHKMRLFTLYKPARHCCFTQFRWCSLLAVCRRIFTHFTSTFTCVRPSAMRHSGLGSLSI